MLQNVDVTPHSLSRFLGVVPESVLDELRELARPLRGARVAQINATPYGGGVSELLRSLIPMYRSLDIQADWLVIPGRTQFFDVTKRIHNALQGADLPLSEAQEDIYVGHNARIARMFTGADYDFVIVHDPQPAPLRQFKGGNGARWVWRCHIDTSSPNQAVFEFMMPFLTAYDALVFTMDQFVPAALRNRHIAIIPPAIDPLSPKNVNLPGGLSSQIVEWTGVRLDNLILTQVSRFDPWKDPMGVIEVYRQVRKDIPGVQLVLLGQMALDDPEGWDMYRQIIDEATGDPDLHVLTNITGIGNFEVNAFQTRSDVVLQKSIREGFGLVVSETLWKGTPVVAGRVGGIPMQMPENTGGYLIDNTDECVARTIELLNDGSLGERLGEAGREHVRENFLITRLLADELRLLNSL